MSTQLSERQRQLDDTDEFLRILRETPLRSIEDIREEREPIVTQPVTAAGMQPERLEPDHYRGRHRKPFRGPSLWRMKSWVFWHFGDLLQWRGLYERERNPHRLV